MKKRSFISILSRRDGSAVFFKSCSLNIYYYNSFLYCIAVLSDAELSDVSKTRTFLPPFPRTSSVTAVKTDVKTDAKTDHKQPFCIKACEVTKYNPKQVKVGHSFFTLGEKNQGAWKYTGADAPNAIVFPLVKISIIKNLPQGGFVFEPFSFFMFDVAENNLYAEETNVRQMLVRFFDATLKENEVYKKNPYAYLAYHKHPDNPVHVFPVPVFLEQKERSIFLTTVSLGLRDSYQEDQERVYSSNKTAFVEDLPGSGSTVLDAVPEDPYTRQEIIYRRDSEDKLASWVTDSSFKKKVIYRRDRWKVDGWWPNPITNQSFVDVMLPLSENLHSSVYLHRDLEGIWTDCPAILVEEIDNLLYKISGFFIMSRLGKDVPVFIEYPVSNAVPVFTRTKEFITLFNRDLFTLNFPILADLEILKVQHVLFFIQSVNYVPIDKGVNIRDYPISEEMMVDVIFVKEYVNFYVDKVVSVALTAEQKKRFGIFQDQGQLHNREAIVTRVAMLIVFGLYRCWERHSSG
jgi:hypothetical protein